MRLGELWERKQGQAVAFYRCERTPVFCARPEPVQGFEVFGRAITFVAGEGELRIKAVELEHVRVPSDLGNY